METYENLVLLCRDKMLDVDLHCDAKNHKEFILKLMGDVSKIVIGKTEYYIGNKFSYLIYDLKNKSGRANFFNKSKWLGINNLIQVI